MNPPRIVRRSESWPENGSMAWGESDALKGEWTKPVLATHRKRAKFDYWPVVFWCGYCACVLAFVAWMLKAWS